MLEGIETGDAEGVGDERAHCRAAAGTGDDSLLAGEVVEVPDDQEVGRIAGGRDHLQLLVEAGARAGRRVLAVAPAEAFDGEPAQVLLGAHPGRAVEGRQLGDAQVDLEVDQAGHIQRGRQRIRQVLEGGSHLRPRLEEEVLRFEAPAAGVVEAVAGLQAEQHVVGLRVLTVDVVEVVGGAEPELELGSQVLERQIDLLLPGDPVPLDLEQVALGAKDIAIGRDRLAGAFQVATGDLGGDFPAQAAGERDHTFGVLGQDLAVDARLVVEALHLAGRAELHQVQVTGAVGGQQRQVVGVAVGAALLAEAGAGRHVDLTAQDGLDPGRSALLVEGDGAVHDAVVGERQRRHLELGGAGHQGLDPAGAVEQRELGVVVEVDELLWWLNRGVRHRLDLGWRDPGPLA